MNETTLQSDAQHWKDLLHGYGLAVVRQDVPKGAKTVDFNLADYGELTRLAVKFKNERKD